ncbi:MAG: TatD family hydrolase [Candidatus Kapaibacteriota bacterium]
MIDTHAHIFSEEFDNDVTEVIENAFNSGVEAIILPAIEPKTFEKVINVSNLSKNLFFSMGVHPHNAQEFNDEVSNKIIEFASNPKMKAIGEIGLDYYYDFAPQDLQKEVFRKQLKLAKELNLPVIIHNRESDDDLLKILNSEQDGSLRGVLHCFSSNEEIMKKAIDLGLLISFTGNITFKKSEGLREIVKLAPIEKIMLETDSPYMTPVPFRGKRNEPKYLELIAKKISEIKLINLEEVIKMTTLNAKKFFNLSIIFIFALLTFFLTDNIFAQDNEEYKKEDETLIHKVLGIGFVLGTNTVVDTYQPNGQDISQDGLFTYGGTLTYHPLKWAFTQFSFVHFKNNKPFVDSKGVLDPIKSNMYELAFGVIPNPESRVNFFLFTGYSITSKTSSKYDWTINKKTVLEDNNSGILAGLGFFANIPIEGAGLFTINAEWRLNFLLNSTVLDYDPRIDYTDPNYKKPTEFTTFFSVPRFGISWYPPFF